MSDKSLRLPLVETANHSSRSDMPRGSSRTFLHFLVILFVSALGIIVVGKDCFPKCFQHFTLDLSPRIFAPSSKLEEFQQCAIKNFHDTGFGFLGTAVPIVLEDFEERRNRLARALVADGVDAFVVEPGYTFKYFANISQPEWEVWEVSFSPACYHLLYPHGAPSLKSDLSS